MISALCQQSPSEGASHPGHIHQASGHLGSLGAGGPVTPDSGACALQGGSLRLGSEFSSETSFLSQRPAEAPFGPWAVARPLDAPFLGGAAAIWVQV